MAHPPAPRLLMPLVAGVQLGQLLTRQKRLPEAMDQFLAVADIAKAPPAEATVRPARRLVRLTAALTVRHRARRALRRRRTHRRASWVSCRTRTCRR